MRLRSSHFFRVPQQQTEIWRALLQAAQAAGQERFDEACKFQREAMDHCLARGFRAEAVVMELSVAFYQFQTAIQGGADAAAAAITYESAGKHAAELSMDAERIGAETGLAGVRAMQGRYAEAAAAGARAAALAQQCGETEMAFETLRSAGDMMFRAGDRIAAARNWRAALALIEAPNGPDDAAPEVDPSAVVGRLREHYRARGVTVLVAHLDSILQQLADVPGTN